MCLKYNQISRECACRLACNTDDSWVAQTRLFLQAAHYVITTGTRAHELHNKLISASLYRSQAAVEPYLRLKQTTKNLRQESLFPWRNLNDGLAEYEANSCSPDRNFWLKEDDRFLRDSSVRRLRETSKDLKSRSPRVPNIEPFRLIISQGPQY